MIYYEVCPPYFLDNLLYHHHFKSFAYFLNHRVEKMKSILLLKGFNAMAFRDHRGLRITSAAWLLCVPLSLATNSINKITLFLFISVVNY